MYGNDRQSDDCEAAVGVGGWSCCDCSRCRASKEAVSNSSERDYDSNFDGFEHSPEYNTPKKEELTTLNMNRFLKLTRLAALVEFDENYEPLWVPKSQIIGFSETDRTIKITTKFFEKKLKLKRKLKEPLAGQDLVKKYLVSEGHILPIRPIPPWQSLIGKNITVENVTKTILPQQNPPCPYCGTTAYCRCGTPL